MSIGCCCRCCCLWTAWYQWSLYFYRCLCLGSIYSRHPSPRRGVSGFPVDDTRAAKPFSSRDVGVCLVAGDIGRAVLVGTLAATFFFGWLQRGLYVGRGRGGGYPEGFLSCAYRGRHVVLPNRPTCPRAAAQRRNMEMHKRGTSRQVTQRRQRPTQKEGEKDTERKGSRWQRGQ